MTCSMCPRAAGAAHRARAGRGATGPSRSPPPLEPSCPLTANKTRVALLAMAAPPCPQRPRPVHRARPAGGGRRGRGGGGRARAAGQRPAQRRPRAQRQGRRGGRRRAEPRPPGSAACPAALDGLADLGLREAEALRDALFPEGLAVVIGPRGKAQAPQYTLLGRAPAQRPRPALRPAPRRRAERPARRPAGLGRRDPGQRRRAPRPAPGRWPTPARAAEALRTALQRLDREVEREAGGPRADAYLSWAAAVRGVA
jgi:hypothetical protein